jgi:hypothetical protein
MPGSGPAPATRGLHPRSHPQPSLNRLKPWPPLPPPPPPRPYIMPSNPALALSPPQPLTTSYRLLLTDSCSPLPRCQRHHSHSPGVERSDTPGTPKRTSHPSGMPATPASSKTHSSVPTDDCWLPTAHGPPPRHPDRGTTPIQPVTELSFGRWSQIQMTGLDSVCIVCIFLA